MITLADLMGIVKDLHRLRLDQVQSLADEDYDEDQYNLDHLKDIVKTLEKHNNHPFNFEDALDCAASLLAEVVE